MNKLSHALIESISFLPEQSRLQVIENFRQQFAEYRGECIRGYIPIDKSPRDKRITELSQQGMSIKAIAKLMHICPKTVRKIIKGGAF